MFRQVCLVCIHSLAYLVTKKDIYKKEWTTTTICFHSNLAKDIKHSLLMLFASVDVVVPQPCCYCEQRFCRLLVGRDIDMSLLPLAGRDLALEQDVDLAVGPVLHLGQVEECREEADEAGGAPDVAALAAQVGLLRLCVSKIVHCKRFGGGGEASYIRVKHITREENARDINNIIRRTSNTRSQRPKTDRRGLANNNPRSRRGAQNKQHRNNKAEGCLREGCLLVLGDGARDSQGDEEADVDEGAPDVDGATAEVGGEDPGEHDEDHLQGRGD